ncbi:MAG TPA: transcription termination factor NusA [Myxococcales bacterium]|nr:transcription termination factor NusA [Myxococcales bacterium]
MQPQTVNLNLVIDQVAKDKGLERSVLVQTLEQAILQAAKKTFGLERALEARYDDEKGVVELFQAITVVQEITDPLQLINEITVAEASAKGLDVEPGDELVFQIFYRDEDAEAAKAQDEQYGDILKLKTFRRGFGRIAAQTAKQVIIQRTRDAEREIVFNEYRDRKGEIVTGIARRFEHGNIIVDLGRAEAVLPVREQVPRESYRAGDRVQAYVLDVLRESKGPQIILSRTSVHLLTKLFEVEVPEIAEGVVVIEAAAREPGGRAKIAVSSRDPDVDPVGACVGMKGSRVQAVVQELRGEKIDIVPWDEDPARFVCSALAPAEVSRVLIDEANHAMEIIVPDDQLSLAIGRRGQNVRLAAQLTGWKLDINSESRVKEMREFAAQSLGSLPGVNDLLIETMYAHGFRQARDVAEAAPEVLAQIPGIDPAKIAEMQAAARAQMLKDAETLTRMEAEREAARIAEARRHPDELSQTERLLRVRGVGEKTIEQLAMGNYRTVEDLVSEQDVMKMGDNTGIGIKKARQIKAAAESYLTEEARLREELNAERAREPAAPPAAAEEK